jgi:hypothetical protein
MRRRVKVIGRLLGERSCVWLVWAVLDRASRGLAWVVMTPAGVRLLQARRQLLHATSREEMVAEAVTAAAAQDRSSRIRVRRYFHHQQDTSCLVYLS